MIVAPVRSRARVTRGARVTVRYAWVLGALLAMACGDDSASDDSSVGDAGNADGGIGTGDGGGSGGGDGTLRTARIVSAAPTYTLVDERYSYRPRTNEAKSVTFSLMEAPSGMTVQRGQLSWTPGADKTGAHRVVLSATDANEPYGQEFRLTVSSAEEIASGDVPPAGGGVYAKSPRANLLRGAGVQVPPNALPRASRLTVSELEEPPPLPSTVGRLNAVKFGPSGTVFSTTASITLPLPDAEEVALSRATLNAYVYDSSGRWHRAQVLAVDLDNRTMTARAQHFSIYAAAQSQLALTATLRSAPADSECARTLVAQATVESSLSQVSIAAVNNLDERFSAQLGPEGTVQQLLLLPGFAGSLRDVQVFELVEQTASGEVPREERMVVTTLYLPGDGTATVTHADALGNVLFAKAYPEPLLSLADLEARLRGGATSVHFTAAPMAGLAVAPRVHLLYFDGDASRDPVSEGDLGLAAVEPAPVPYAADVLSAPDGDCDGLLDAYDESDDRLAPRIVATPNSVQTLLPNEPITLRAQLLNADSAATVSWTAASGGMATPGVLSEVTEDPDARVFRASTPGVYAVLVVAQSGTTRLEHLFSLDLPELPETNTAPTCEPSKTVDLGRVGESVALTAIATDVESSGSALRVEWGLVDPDDPTKLVTSPALIASGTSAVFAPTSADTYRIGCRAYDGQSYGPVASAPLSVVAADANRPPVDLTLSPHFASVPAATPITLYASARDPDGDALTFTWRPPYGDGETVTSSDGTSAFAFTTPNDEGTFVVILEVSDGKGGPALAMSTQILVGEMPTGQVDADADGWYAGTGAQADCDDGENTVYPTAPEICDQSDNDCDGVTDEGCPTMDGGVVQMDGGTASDAGVVADACRPEICNNIDDDCDNEIDEGLICQCTSYELCNNQVDDNCDGLIDLLDPLCCVPVGNEICADDVDNDCDGFIDGLDSECADAGVSLDASVLDGASR